MNLTKYRECHAHKNAIYIGTDESCRPCCYYKHSVSIDDITSWQDYQEQIQKTDIETGCKHCIDLENNGSTISHRLIIDTASDMHIHVCPTNICNLKCPTCGPSSSTFWIDDADKLGLLDPTTKKRFQGFSRLSSNKISFCKDIILSADHDKKISVTIYGGEPMISPDVIEFVEFLETLPNFNNIHIGFITNGTKISPEFEKCIKNGLHSSVHVSIDSTENRNNYLRYGSKWNDIEQNLIKYSDLATNNKDFHVGIHMTLSWMNAYYFADFCEWLISILQTDNAVPLLHLTKLIEPTYYSLDNWTPELKKTVLEANVPRVNKLIENTTNEFLQQQLKHLLECYETSLITYVSGIPANKTDCSEGLDIMYKLDALRNTNADETFEEIIKLIR